MNTTTTSGHDKNLNCTECGEHISNPHAPGCDADPDPISPPPAVKRASAKRVYTDDYRASHGRNPRGYGFWIFRNRDTGALTEVPNSTYGDAKRKLTRGEWDVCP